MSSNRKIYDKCCYKEQIAQATKPFDLRMDPIAFEHQSACRIESGVVGGNNVSTVGNTREAGNGQLIDVDSKLKGLNKYISDCSVEQVKRTKLNIDKPINLKTCNIIKHHK